MSPNNKCEINGHVIEEFWWAGKSVVYVDNKLTEKSYSDACEDLRSTSSQ